MKNLMSMAVLAIILISGEVVFGQASANIGIYFGTPPAPPPIRQEVIIVRPYQEAVWVPGYWNYDYGVHNYVWQAGAWNRPPSAGASWSPGVWKHHAKGYSYAPGHWAGSKRASFSAPGNSGHVNSGRGNGRGNGNGKGKGHK